MSDHKHLITTAKQATISWLWLMLLSILSVIAGLYFKTSSFFIVAVFLIVFLKGQQVTDMFMELRFAPALWRYLLLGYVVLLPVILTIIYLF